MICGESSALERMRYSMSIVSKIRKLLNRPELLSQEQVERIKRLPKNQAQKELCSILYRQSEKWVTAFVQEQLHRVDSPYQGISIALFFHEMIAVTLWIMDREIAGGKLAMMEHLHDDYFRVHTSLDHSTKDHHAALLVKYRQYEDHWNEITGHLDEFGLYVAQNLFGKDDNIRTRERTFWIIQYADEVGKKVSPIRRVWKELVTA